MKHLLTLLLTLHALCVVPAAAEEAPSDAAPATPEATVDAFHQALIAGEGDAALAFLAPDVVVFEEGSAQMDRDEYELHHLGADMSFAAEVERKLVDRQSGSDDGTAWVFTRSTSQGTFRDFEIDAVGSETMLLRHTEDGWRIFHIHWSSHSK